MTTLAAAKIRGLLAQLFIDPPMVATDTIYLGAAVGADGSGNARPLVAGDPFLGFCADHAENTGAAAARRVHVAAVGGAWLSVTNVNSVDDCPCAVYASDDDTFTTTASGNSYVGQAIFFNTNDSLAFVMFAPNKGVTAISDGATDAPEDAATNAPVDASVVHALADVFDDEESEAALNALGGKINDVAAIVNANATKQNEIADNLNAAVTQLNLVITALESKGIVKVA